MRGILLQPIITEKLTDITEQMPNRYGFKVARNANKTAIKEAVEKMYDVDVVSVNTINYDGKAKRLGAARPGRRKSWKKAYVQLTQDSKTIEFFEGMV